MPKLMPKKNKTSTKLQNLQNALSFARVQDEALKIVGEIVSKSALLKTKYESGTANFSDKAAYDEEFRELQIQLKNIREQKLNGVSLFSVLMTRPFSRNHRIPIISLLMQTNIIKTLS